MLAFLRHVLLSLCLWVAAGASAAASPPRLQALDWWMGSAGQASLDEVRQVSDWRPFSGWKSLGFGSEPVWIRLQVRAALPGEPDRWIVQVRPPFLDQITLYDPAGDRPLRLGDFHGTADDALGSLPFAFEVPALPEARTLYLRLESTSTRTVQVEVLDVKTAQRQARQLEWLLGGLIVLSAVFAVWGLVQWASTREGLLGIFALKQVVSTLWALFVLGFARVTVGDLLPPGALSFLAGWLVIGVVVVCLWFMGGLIREYAPRRWMLRGLQGMTLAVALLWLLHAVGMTRQALEALNLVLLPSMAWLTLTLALSRTQAPETVLARKWLLAYVAYYAVMNSIPTVLYLGWVDEIPVMAFTHLLHVLMDGLVMFVILRLRSRRMAERRAELEQQLAVSTEQARLDRQYLEEQRRLLVMLAHEIKTPLTSLRIWMTAGPKGQEVMARTIDDMSALVERCVQTGQLADPSLQPRLQATELAVLTRQAVEKSRAPGRVRLELPDVKALADTDAQMLSIVLCNVLDNACKYSPADSPVTVQLDLRQDGEDAPGWTWAVENEPGLAGFPEPERVFEKYYRSPNAQRQPGSGLGLYLVRSLVQLMGGRIRYLARNGRVRFEIWLPAASRRIAALS